MKSNKSFDVIVVGAGAAGVGVGMALKRVGVESVILLERGTVGESFRRWPEEMRAKSKGGRHSGLHAPPRCL